MLRQASFLLQEFIAKAKNLRANPCAGLETGLNLCQLESRIMMSATPLAVVAESVAIEPSVEAAIPASDGEPAQPSVDAQSQQLVRTTREIVFIDGNVPQYATLIADLQAQQDAGRLLDVHVLDSQRDGLDQISQFLAAYEDVFAVHILTHGSGASVQLGSSQLTADSLSGYAGQISRWADALNQDADILLYGCDLAIDASGKQLVDALSALTGADVAASTDDTGHALLGGNWELEYATGSIEARVALSLEAQDSWGHLLNLSVDATSVSTVAAGALSELVSHTTSGTNRLMLVAISLGEDNGVSVSSVTYNGTALSSVGARDHADATTARVEIWSLVAPDIGTHNLVVNFSGAAHAGATIGVMTFNGVDQSNALGNFASSQGNSSTPGAFVTSAAGELVFSAVALDLNSDIDFVPGGGQVEKWDLFSDRANGAGSIQAGSPSTLTSWTSPSSGKWVVGGISIKPSVELAATSEFRVNTNTANTQETSLASRGSHRAIAMAANGDYVVVWSALGLDGSGWGIYGQLFDKNGTPQSAELPINQSFLNDQLHATVGMDAAGNFVVAWTNKDAAGGDAIFARRFDADGTPLAGEFRVSDLSSEDRMNPSVAVAANGNFVISWQGLDGSDTGDIFVRRYDALGNALDINDIAVELAAGGDFDPTVAINDNGQFAVLWDDSGGVFVQRYHSNGTANGGQINIDDSSHAGDGTLALNNDGSFVAVWREGIGGRDSFLRRFSSTGVALDVAQLVATSTTNDQTNPSIAMDKEGNFMVVWEGNGTQPGQLDSSGIFGQKYDANGTPLGGEFLINQTTSGTQRMASVAMLDLNNFVVVWSGEGNQVNNVDTSGVFARQFGTLNINSPISTISDSNPAANQVSEGAANGTTVGLTASAFDTDVTDAIVYSLDASAGGRFAINTATGVVTVANGSLLDFENATSHSITVRATSSDASASTRSFVISVLNINDNVPVVVAGQVFHVSEAASNGTTLGIVAATDADAGTTLGSWTITGGNSDGVFWINNATGQLSVADNTLLNFEATSSYHLTVSVSDGVHTSLFETMTVTIDDVNEPPVIVANQLIDKLVATSATKTPLVVAAFEVFDDALGSHSISLGGADASLFQIRGNRLELRAGSEIVAGHNLRVRIRVDDPSIGTGHDAVAVIRITVSQNEARPIVVPSQPIASESQAGSARSTPEEAHSETSQNATPASAGVAPIVVAASGKSDVEAEVIAEEELVEPLVIESTGVAIAIEAQQRVVEETAQDSSARRGAEIDSQATVQLVAATTHSSVFADYSSLSNHSLLWEQLDSFHESVENNVQLEGIVMGSVSAVTSSLTVGYVVWMVRGGVVASTLLAQLPAWKYMDAMVVLAHIEENDDDEEGSLESIVDQDLDNAHDSVDEFLRGPESVHFNE